LNEKHSEDLLQLLLELKKNGIASVLISHKLKEVAKVSDSITIIRDGKVIETLDVGDTPISENRIIRGMVGREITDLFPKRDSQIGDVAFEVRNWNVYHAEDTDRKVVDNVSFKVRAGEVVGLSGLVGAGRTELAMSLFGKSYGQKISGEIFINGKKVQMNSIPKAIKNGVAYVTEDRKQYGLVLMNDVRWNTTLAKLQKITHHGVINDYEEISEAEKYKTVMNIKTPSVFQLTNNLSGGNQQKVVLAKWMFTDPKILILDEPTRGIDVGAKYEIYTIINTLAAQGMACILISSEMPEVIGMSDRLYVMSEGRFTAELDGKTATQEEIMHNIIQPLGETP
jgi:putative multiple sugar transport system ATP-binding protein